MNYGGGGWKPGSRRNRRQGRTSRRTAEGGADRTLVLILVGFCVIALVLAVVAGLSLT